MKGAGYIVSAFGCTIRATILGFGFHVWGHASGIRVPSSGIHVSLLTQGFQILGQLFGLRVEGIRFRVTGLGSTESVGGAYRGTTHIRNSPPV